jgi:molecular chaperone DnaK
MAADNKLLGQFDLIGIPPAPRGVPQIDVTFDIDANGIVHVSAKDLATNKEQSIRITASSGLAKDEIEKLIKEAQSHSEDDRKKRELAEVRNQADTLVYSVEKSLAEFGDKISEYEKTTIQEKIAQVRKAIEGNDISAIKMASDELTKVSHRLAEEMYKKAGSTAGAGTTAGGSTQGSTGESSSGSGPTMDAEFREENK